MALAGSFSPCTPHNPAGFPLHIKEAKGTLRLRHQDHNLTQDQSPQKKTKTEIKSHYSTKPYFPWLRDTYTSQ